jgi:hypothetical protein
MLSSFIDTICKLLNFTDHACICWIEKLVFIFFKYCLDVKNKQVANDPIICINYFIFLSINVLYIIEKRFE